MENLEKDLSAEKGKHYSVFPAEELEIREIVDMTFDILSITKSQSDGLKYATSKIFQKQAELNNCCQK